MARGYIARVPVAWIEAGAATPPGPFPPLPPISGECTAVNVSGAGLAGVDGVYSREAEATGAGATWNKDATHQLYFYGGAWKLATMGVGVFYLSEGSGVGPPAAGSKNWVVESQGSPPIPTSITFAVDEKPQPLNVRRRCRGRTVG